MVAHCVFLPHPMTLPSKPSALEKSITIGSEVWRYVFDAGKYIREKRDQKEVERCQKLTGENSIVKKLLIEENKALTAKLEACEEEAEEHRGTRWRMEAERLAKENAVMREALGKQKRLLADLHVVRPPFSGGCIDDCLACRGQKEINKILSSLPTL